jgi:hypothetical protein
MDEVGESNRPAFEFGEFGDKPNSATFQLTLFCFPVLLTLAGAG